MRPADHNKILGITHLAYGGFTVFVMALVSFFMLGAFGIAAISQPRGEAVPLGLMLLLIAFVVLVNLLIIAPSFLAGYALLKKKRWAKTIGIIAGIIAGMSFPIGTAVCVYTLWFFFGENGKSIYDGAAYALPPAPPLFAGASRKQEPQYVPPLSPPDWR